jgi:hypothetical protein
MARYVTGQRKGLAMQIPKVNPVTMQDAPRSPIRTG